MSRFSKVFPYVIWILVAVCAGAADSGQSTRIEDEIRDLRQRIRYHNDLYYRELEPEISDAAFDGLCTRLQQLESKYPEAAAKAGKKLAGFGDDRTEAGRSSKHESPMLSLHKCYSISEVIECYRTWQKKLNVETLAVRLEPKVDGVAINAIYRDGVLEKVLSRGDGDEGQDLTRQALQTGCVPQVLETGYPVPAVVELRGEAYIPRDTFRELNKRRQLQGAEPYASERNLAAGTLRHKDLSTIRKRGLKIVFFTTGSWLPGETCPETESGLQAVLKGWEIPTLEFIRVIDDEDELETAILDMEAARERWNYPVDGIVMELEDHAHQHALGTLAAAPRWATAYKFKSSVVESVLRGIIWQEGKTGKRTPVAQFDPVVIGGRTISRASLYSKRYLEDNDFKEGDPILVELRGDVIPVISKK